MKRWLFPALTKAWEALGLEGNLAVHMCDTRIVEPMLLFLSTLPGAEPRGVLACTGSKPKPRPVWVFRKRPRSGDHARAASEAMHRHYPNLC